MEAYFQEEQNTGEDTMETHFQEEQHNGNNTLTLFAGMLLGGLAGAAAMLLLTPQSGKKTRAQIQHKGVELRDQATETVEDALAQAGKTARQVTGDVRGKAEELQQRGQDMLDEQRKRLSTFVDVKDKEDINVPA